MQKTKKEYKKKEIHDIWYKKWEYFKQRISCRITQTNTLEHLRKVHSSFKYNIWGADVADMQLINKFNKGICFLLCVIGIFSKYEWVIPLKDKKGITITNTFQKNFKESNRKRDKIWVNKFSES